MHESPSEEPAASERDVCWECGREADCQEHFIGCAGAVVRLCDACREAAERRRNETDPDGRRSC